MLVHVEIPGMSLNLQDPLLRLTCIHPRQTGGIPIGQVFTDCARDGGVGPIRLPGSGTGLVHFYHNIALYNLTTLSISLAH